MLIWASHGTQITEDKISQNQTEDKITQGDEDSCI